MHIGIAALALVVLAATPTDAGAFYSRMRDRSLSTRGRTVPSHPAMNVVVEEREGVYDDSAYDHVHVDDAAASSSAHERIDDTAASSSAHDDSTLQGERQRTTGTLFTDLPSDFVGQVLNHLRPEDAARLATANHNTHGIYTANFFPHRQLRSEFTRAHGSWYRVALNLMRVEPADSQYEQSEEIRTRIRKHRLLLDYNERVRTVHGQRPLLDDRDLGRLLMRCTRKQMTRFVLWSPYCRSFAERLRVERASASATIREALRLFDDAEMRISAGQALHALVGLEMNVMNTRAPPGMVDPRTEQLIAESLLIDHRASDSMYGMGVLGLAIERRSLPMVRLLLRHGVDVDDTPMAPSALALAVRAGNPEIIAEVLRYRPNLEARVNGHRTALHLAVEMGDVQTVQQLLAAGADVHAPDFHEKTPLDHAIEAGNDELVSVLRGQ